MGLILTTGAPATKKWPVAPVLANTHLALRVPRVRILTFSYKVSFRTLFTLAIFWFVIMVFAITSNFVCRFFILLSHFIVASVSLQDSDYFISVIFSMTTGLFGVG